MSELKKLRRYLESEIESCANNVNALQNRIDDVEYQSTECMSLKTEQWGHLLELNTLRGVLAAVELLEK